MWLHGTTPSELVSLLAGNRPLSLAIHTLFAGETGWLLSLLALPTVFGIDLLVWTVGLGVWVAAREGWPGSVLSALLAPRPALASVVVSLSSVLVGAGLVLASGAILDGVTGRKRSSWQPPWVRDTYRESLGLRALVTMIPVLGGAIDLVLSWVRGPGGDRFFITVDRAFLKYQSKREVKTILGASVGDWPLIARGLDLERDLQDPLMRLVSAPRDHAALLVILGDPGAGKTTLLRRLGKDLAEDGRPVLELRAAARGTVGWLSALTQLRRQSRRQPILLIDDIFRYEGIEDMLCDPTLDCTIIATSRTNEDRTRYVSTTNMLERLCVRVEGQAQSNWPRLEAPSERELAALRLRFNWPHLSDKKWREITTMRRGNDLVTAPLLVIMLQLAAYDLPTGHVTPFHEIISKTVEGLRQQNPDTYRAFGAICAFHRLGLQTPSAILDVLVRPGFGRALRADVAGPASTCAARGVIIPGQYHLYRECWQTGHEIIAEAATELEYADSVESYYEAVVKGANPSDREQAVFVCHMIHALLAHKHMALTQVLARTHAEHLDAHVAADPHRQVDWAHNFDVLGDRERGLRCLMGAEPKTARRMTIMLGLLEKYGKIQMAMSTARSWLEQHDEDSQVRTRYLGLVERRGNSEQVTSALLDTRDWLKRHDDNSEVRARYLAFVRRKAVPDWVATAVADAGAWLEKHEGESNVRVNYLALVESRGDPEQIASALDHTGAWLVRHDEDCQVRACYLGLTERKGNADQVAAVLQETRTWLARHEEDTEVRIGYLAVVEKKGDAGQVGSALTDVLAWLRRHDEDHYIRMRCLLFVGRKGNSNDVTAAITDTAAWLARHREDAAVRARYLILIEKRGGPGQVASALADTGAWLERNEDHSVRVRYLLLAGRKGSLTQLVAVVHKTRAWLECHDKDTGVRSRYLWLAAAKGGTGQTRVILKDVERWLKRHTGEDTDILARFLTLLKRWGAKEQKDSWVTLAFNWCQRNHAPDVLVALLTLACDCRDPTIRRSIVELAEQRASGCGRLEWTILGLCATLCESFLPPGEVRQRYVHALAAASARKTDIRSAFGRFLASQGDYQAAEHELRLACASRPTDSSIRDQWAFVLAALGRDEEAQQAWQQAIAHGHGMAKYRNNLGLFYTERGRLTEARKAFEDALAVKPDFFWAAKGLGEVNLREGNVEAAKRRFAQALALIPSSEEYLEARAQVQQRMRELFGAIPGVDPSTSCRGAPSC